MTKKILEQKKSKAFYEVVEPFFFNYFKEEYELVEFCAGNGNGGKVFSQKGKISKVHFVDIRTVRNLEKTISELDNVQEVSLVGIENYELPEGNIAVIAIHACGELTDLILEKSIQSHVTVAVMPCCYGNIRKYNLQNPPDSRLLLYPRKEDYFDKVRQQFLLEQGYEAVLKKIDSKITPMNNVLIGLP